MIKNIIFIALALFFIISLVNNFQVKPTTSVTDQVGLTVNNMIGCQDFMYTFQINVPAIVTFTVTKGNGVDEVGPFKLINADSTGVTTTVLHCGNDYNVVYSAAGYKDLTENISITGFKPLIPTVKQINLEPL